jgi:peptidoglycan/xylan/chitin deacetylase (PgdA/CDA1 family)
MRRAESLLRSLESVGADRWMRPWLAGRGVVFVLHRAAPAGSTVLDPDLTVTADLLDHALRMIDREGYVAVGVDEIRGRLHGAHRGRFAAFTFDDGYRDNLTVALPVFRSHRVPMCIYVTTGLIDRTAPCWWAALAHLVESRAAIDLAGLGLSGNMPTGSWPEKRAAFARIETWVHGDLESRSESVRHWCRDAGVDERSVLDDAMLTWDELRELARDPLVTIGAHGVTHRRLSRLDDDSARRELAESRARLEAELDRPVRHLAYPYGGPAACGPREFQLASEAGFLTAVTTRNGNVFGAHAGRVTALPRRRLTEGVPDARTARRALTGTQWLLRRGPRVVTS